MVTIDQKLALFSSLLQRSMNEKFAGDLEKLKAEYRDKILKNREAADAEAEEIIRKSVKKAEAEKARTESRDRIWLKKEITAVRQNLFETFMKRLREEIDRFVQSEKYGGYLEQLVGKYMETERPSTGVTVYMTERDCARFADIVRSRIAASVAREAEADSRDIDVAFEKAPDSIIGGFIAVDSSRNVRVDLSVQRLLEDNRTYIMNELFRAMETGETNGA